MNGARFAQRGAVSNRYIHRKVRSVTIINAISLVQWPDHGNIITVGPRLTSRRPSEPVEICWNVVVVDANKWPLIPKLEAGI